MRCTLSLTCTEIQAIIKKDLTFLYVSVIFLEQLDRAHRKANKVKLTIILY